MTREEIEKWIPILKAFSKGAKLQLFSSDEDRWIDCDETLQEFNFAYLTNCKPFENIRIKPCDNSDCIHHFGGCPKSDSVFGCLCEHEEFKNSFCEYYRHKDGNCLI